MIIFNAVAFFSMQNLSSTRSSTLKRGLERSSMGPPNKVVPDAMSEAEPPKLKDPSVTLQGISINSSELSSQRLYKLHMEGVANVKEWGAIGDGKADDTKAIEAAIEAVVQSSSGMCHTYCLRRVSAH
jgi:hypothetical protein